MNQHTNQLDNIVEVSTAVSTLPGNVEVELAGGRSVTVRRLSWIQFELLWGELATLLSQLANLDPSSAILQPTGGALPAADDLAARLSGAPAFVLRLASLSAGQPEAELSGWGFDDVLAVAAAALRLSFIESAGVRDFFAALALAASQVVPQPAPGQSAAAPSAR